MLKQQFPQIFNDPQLLRKLNIIGIGEGIMWISQNWSAQWNKQQVRHLVEEEVVGDEDGGGAGDLSGTYYGKVLGRSPEF